MGIIKKQFSFEVKQIGEDKDRVLRFCGSDETPDRDRDILEVAGWVTSEYMKNPVFLWAHNGYSVPPIGKCIKVTKDAILKKLMFDIKFPTLEELSSDIENPAEHAKFADMIYNMYKNGYLNAVSVGFKGVKYKTRDDEAVLTLPEWQRGRRYMEQNLLELSAVPIPANPNAIVEARGKGLIDENTIKSFFIPEKEIEIDDESKVLKVKMPTGEINSITFEFLKSLDEDSIKMFTEYKAGARFSKETIENIKTTLQKMGDMMDTHGKAHKEAMKAYKGCMDEFKALMGETAEESEMESEDAPKSSDSDSEKSDGLPANADEAMENLGRVLADISGKIEGISKSHIDFVARLDALQQIRDSDGIEPTQTNKDASKDEINLDAIEFPNTAKSTEQNELDLKPEEIKTMMEEVLTNKFNALTGRI